MPLRVVTRCIDNAPPSIGCNSAVPPIAVAGFNNVVVTTATKPTDCNGQMTLQDRQPPTTMLFVHGIILGEIHHRSACRQA
jgi:hypothetical protein